MSSAGGEESSLLRWTILEPTSGREAGESGWGMEGDVSKSFSASSRERKIRAALVAFGLWT